MEGRENMGETVKVSREAEARKILRMVIRLVKEGKTIHEIIEALEAYVDGF